MIQKIADELGPKFVFGPHTEEDIKQQIWYFGLQILNKFPNMSEESLYKHIRNRLMCWKRDQYGTGKVRKNEKFKTI